MGRQAMESAPPLREAILRVLREAGHPLHVRENTEPLLSSKLRRRPNAAPVALIGGEQLVALLIEHEVGVRRTPFALLQREGSLA